MTDEELFEKAEKLDGAEQLQFLLAECHHEGQIKRVQKLLAAAQTPDSLLDTTAMNGLDETVEQRVLPKSIGDFELLRELGRGGMGVVYEARQKSLRRKVALKILSSGLGLSSKAILRFRREAEAAGKLHHTNIVPIYTTGEDKGIHFYAMELIDGPSLDRVIQEMKQAEYPEEALTASIAKTPTPPHGIPDRRAAEGANQSKVATWENSARLQSSVATSISTTSGNTYADTIAAMIADVAEALDHAHEHGVIHRDVKPSNLLLAPDGRLSINDFGLARMLEQPGVTVSGEFVGSPLYMSPEQITAGRVQLDHRTDIYSLGATLYELLTLQPPFPGQTRDQVLSQILHKEATTARKLNRKIPIDLDTICMKAIEKDPDRRYQTAGELAQDLRNYVNRYAISARRIGPVGRMVRYTRRNPSIAVASAILLTTALVFGGFILWDREKDRKADIENLTQQIYSDVFRGDSAKLDEYLTQLENLRISENRREFLRGIKNMMKENHEDALENFSRVLSVDPDNVAAMALKASGIFWSGDEVDYLNELHRIPVDKAKSFEDRLFLGYASTWGFPEQAKELLEAANNERPQYQFIQLQLGEALRCLATNVDSDLDAAEKHLDEAYNYLQIAKLVAPSHDSNWSRVAVVMDQAVLFDRMTDLAAVNDRSRWQKRAGEKREELRELTRDFLSKVERESSVVPYLAMVHAMIYLGMEPELETQSETWFERSRDLNAYAAFALCEHFVESGDFEKAEKWFAYSQAKRPTDAFGLRGFSRLVAASDEESTNSLRSDVAIRLDKKLNGDPGSIFYYVLLMYLLGDDTALRHLHRDSFFENIFAKGSFAPIAKYFAKNERNDEDREILINGCLETNAPNFALMHARLALGIEMIVEGRDDDARRYFQECIDGRQYIWHCHGLSKIMLKYDDQWTTWRTNRLKTVE